MTSAPNTRVTITAGATVEIENQCRSTCAFLSNAIPRQIRAEHHCQRSSLSDLGHATIDEEFDARDVATFLGRKEDDRFGNFIQGSRATERYFVHDAVCVLFDLFFRHAQGIAVAGRRNHARTNSVDADLAVFQIRGEGAGEGTHGGFGCAVDAERRRPCTRNDRRIQNDGASIPEEREGLLHGKQKTLDVSVENLVEMLFGDCPERGEFSSAGIGE